MPGEVSGKGEIRNPIQAILNRRFIKEGENITYCGFSEPFISSYSHKLLPGLEIFQDCISKPKLFASNDRMAEGNEDEGLGELFEEGDRAKQDNGVRERLQKLFATTVTPEMLIFTDSDGSEDDEDVRAKEEFRTTKAEIFENERFKVENLVLEKFVDFFYFF